MLQQCVTGVQGAVRPVPRTACQWAASHRACMARLQRGSTALNHLLEVAFMCQQQPAGHNPSLSLLVSYRPLATFSHSSGSLSCWRRRSRRLGCLFQIPVLGQRARRREAHLLRCGSYIDRVTTTRSQKDSAMVTSWYDTQQCRSGLHKSGKKAQQQEGRIIWTAARPPDREAEGPMWTAAATRPAVVVQRKPPVPRWRGPPRDPLPPRDLGGRATRRGCATRGRGAEKTAGAQAPAARTAASATRADCRPDRERASCAQNAAARRASAEAPVRRHLLREPAPPAPQPAAPARPDDGSPAPRRRVAASRARREAQARPRTTTRAPLFTPRLTARWRPTTPRNQLTPRSTRRRRRCRRRRSRHPRRDRRPRRRRRAGPRWRKATVAARNNRRRARRSRARAAPPMRRRRARGSRRAGPATTATPGRPRRSPAPWPRATPPFSARPTAAGAPSGRTSGRFVRRRGRVGRARRVGGPAAAELDGAKESAAAAALALPRRAADGSRGGVRRAAARHGALWPRRGPRRPAGKAIETVFPRAPSFATPRRSARRLRRVRTRGPAPMGSHLLTRRAPGGAGPINCRRSASNATGGRPTSAPSPER